MLELKALFMKTLPEWMTAPGMFSFSNLSKLIDICNFKI